MFPQDPGWRNGRGYEWGKAKGGMLSAQNSALCGSATHLLSGKCCLRMWIWLQMMRSPPAPAQSTKSGGGFGASATLRPGKVLVNRSWHFCTSGVISSTKMTPLNAMLSRHHDDVNSSQRSQKILECDATPNATSSSLGFCASAALAKGTSAEQRPRQAPQPCCHSCNHIGFTIAL